MLKLDRCKHKGNIYPSDNERSLHLDPIIGWIVEVVCEDCGRMGVAPVDCKNVEWEEKNEQRPKTKND